MNRKEGFVLVATRKITQEVNHCHQKQQQQRYDDNNNNTYGNDNEGSYLRVL